MFINTIDCRDWSECDPSHSQDQVTYLRPAIAELREKLEALDPNVPEFDETARDDMKNIKWFIQRVMKLFDDWPEYWSEEYLREVDAE